MLHTNNPLLDKEFLSLLDAHRERETYARIIALSFQEDPLEQIEGRVTQGSINIDGASALRRTCSLSLIAEEMNINDFYWGLKSKFKLEVGLRNTIKNMVYNEITGERWGDKYPQDIIWFPQGVYAITAFNTTYNTTGYTINISGKDKMCFLNGDLGGSLIASIDFGVEEYYNKDDNTTTYTPIPIEKIIREAVHTYANEPYYNIIINDLDEIAVELLEYRGDTPMYLLYDTTRSSFTNFTLNGDMPCYDYITGQEYTLNSELIIYDPRINLSYTTEINPTQVIFNGDSSNGIYTIAKIEYGQSVGYRPTELTYAGDLISSVGESITSILDKIKKMLGEYEYFYDVEGHFVFQRKKTYIQSTWNNIIKVGDDQYVENAAYSSAVFYRFEGNNLLTSFANTPNLSNLKNDYSIWGERTGVSGIKIPVHYRYAIDKKPEKYTSIISGITYTSEEYDWRELIYQMAVDHHAHSQYDDYIDKLIEANPETCANGTTGYEQYYVDIISFWRELYENKLWKEEISTAPDQLNFWFDFLDGEVWWQVYNKDTDKYYTYLNYNDLQQDLNRHKELLKKDSKDYTEIEKELMKKLGNNPKVRERTTDLNQFSVKAVGDRVKAVNDTSVTAIYFREVPDLIFTTYKQYNESGLADKSGYTPVFINGSLENMFNISAQGKSAQDLMDELVYNHSYCIESVTIQSVPIYHLQPNIRIYVNDEKSKVQGEYIINKLTIPLAYNGIMSITATKAPERIY